MYTSTMGYNISMVQNLLFLHPCYPRIQGLRSLPHILQYCRQFNASACQAQHDAFQGRLKTVWRRRFPNLWVNLTLPVIGSNKRSDLVVLDEEARCVLKYCRCLFQRPDQEVGALREGDFCVPLRDGRRHRRRIFRDVGTKKRYHPEKDWCDSSRSSLCPRCCNILPEFTEDTSACVTFSQRTARIGDRLARRRHTHPVVISVRRSAIPSALRHQVGNAWNHGTCHLSYCLCNVVSCSVNRALTL
ncbi:hypothetical protein T4D_17176 [Trichinella pseudospiralis]|uniref:Uncharacterized protein n=1 Tax=Trichinella pseudospiralis TaxID=6337 RepID=A0A0V1F5L8_TRIPS|nr:hypothetical protein T4D_17176 [Trichinella pseudospiralis]